MPTTGKDSKHVDLGWPGKTWVLYGVEDTRTNQSHLVADSVEVSASFNLTCQAVSVCQTLASR